MPVIKGLEWTFDMVAASYEKLRPGYTDDLYRTLFDYIKLNMERIFRNYVRKSSRSMKTFL